MRIRQTLRHFAARAALETPLVGDKVRAKLVALHTRVFLERADPDHRDARRARLDAFFDATMDVYLAALAAGYSEAGARELTHILANVEFARHGWTEMMEFPVAEVDEQLSRYADLCAEHGITAERPLGRFTPQAGLPDAPATPERLDAPEQPHAEAGYADDLYVEDAEGELKRADPRERS